MGQRSLELANEVDATLVWGRWGEAGHVKGLLNLRTGFLELAERQLLEKSGLETLKMYREDRAIPCQ